MPLVFEPLTRDVEGGRVVPWLASEVIPEEGGARFRFRLRRGVRFHDGRALSARDVRFSFERILQKGTSGGRFLLAPIRGAQSLLDGKASDLEGFHIVSPSEFVIELEKPLAFFPVLVSWPGAGILPEGTGAIGESWRKGCIGTGPYRVDELRARKTAGTRAESRLLARGLSEERRGRLPVRRSPRGDPLRVPGRPVLPRFGPPPDRRRGPSPGPALPCDVSREPEPRDVLRGLQRPQGSLRGPSDAPRRRPGDRRRRHRPPDARPARDSGQRPHPARPPRVRLEAAEPLQGARRTSRARTPSPARRSRSRPWRTRSCSGSSAPSPRSSCRPFARWASASAS